MIEDELNITVTKWGYSVPVSCCVMTAHTGVNYCEHPPPPPVSKWRSFKWELQAWWWENRPHIHRGPCEVDE